MAIIYVAKESVREAIDFFRDKTFTSGEQIGLFFFFKAMGFNSREYITYRATDPEVKQQNHRTFYDLAAMFDAETEEGKRNTALFPFSIIPSVKKSAYYNAGTEFSRIVGRVKDTMDNTLVDDSKYLRKDELDAGKFKFAPDYIDKLFRDFLNGNKISLQKFAAWYYRFYAFTVDEEWLTNPTADTFESFTRLCTKKLIEDLKLTAAELSTLFDTSDGIIKYSAVKTTGEELRGFISYDSAEAQPEVNVVATPITYIQPSITVAYEEVQSLTIPHGNNLTSDQLVRLLLDTKQAVLSGPPGTGKSYISSQVRTAFDESFIVQFHPNLTYEQFIGGSTFDDSGNVKSQAGIFLEFCEKARKPENADKKFLFLIDEINRGNVSKIFGETILALDREYTVNLPTKVNTEDGEVVETFSIPENVYILATMNSADRSIALVDYAIRRRFAFVTFFPNSEIVDAMSDYFALDGLRVSDIMKGINEKISSVLSDSDLELGQSYFLPKWAPRNPTTRKILWSPALLRDQFNYYILPIIEEYTYGNKRYLLNIIGDKLISRISDETEFMGEIRYQFKR